MPVAGFVKLLSALLLCLSHVSTALPAGDKGEAETSAMQMSRNRRNAIPQMHYEQEEVQIKPHILLEPVSEKMPWGGSLEDYSLDFKWKATDVTNMSMVLQNTYIQVPVTGLYYLYSQMFFKLNKNNDFGHCITTGTLTNNDQADVKEVFCTREQTGPPVAKSKYIGGAVFLNKKDIIGVRMNPIKGNNAKRPRTVYLDKRLTFFGAYLT